MTKMVTKTVTMIDMTKQQNRFWIFAEPHGASRKSVRILITEI